ncbi:hypothetical protein LAZ67_2003979 [Cordylochernes scorpioides]|uniref:HTH CENPB-type domain-containing protein n=1 Tax=Cordylochernes scorpioides TaxID=51811 RepID=A0ABY6K816_9ARAC|nr:hypothetical protein LAZ67_2003979 [Cordylochernes scorpioides]
MCSSSSKCGVVAAGLPGGQHQHQQFNPLYLDPYVGIQSTGPEYILPEGGLAQNNHRRGMFEVAFAKIGTAVIAVECYSTNKLTAKRCYSGERRMPIGSRMHTFGFCSILKCDCDEEFPEIEEALFRWIRQANAMKLAINGNILKEKAILLTLKMDQDNFEASNGWLEKFKARRNILLNDFMEKLEVWMSIV